MLPTGNLLDLVVSNCGDLGRCVDASRRVQPELTEGVATGCVDMSGDCAEGSVRHAAGSLLDRLRRWDVNGKHLALSTPSPELPSLAFPHDIQLPFCRCTTYNKR
jgi:hypothetical protein